MSVPNPKEYYEDGLRDGALNERERIIKLLESNQVLKETKLKKWLFAQGFRFAIAVIKGENK